MRSLLPAVAACSLLAACAPPTYLRPDTANQTVAASVQGTKANILGAAVGALSADGYLISAVDHDTSLVATAPRPMVVTAAQADCGREKAALRTADVLTAVRDPDTFVAFNVFAQDNHIELRATIEDRRNPIDPRTPVTCVSRGVLEQAMLLDIKARL